MEFEWDSLWVLIALLVGVLPLIVVRVRKFWKWYQKRQSGSNETLSEHIARIEKEDKVGGKK